MQILFFTFVQAGFCDPPVERQGRIPPRVQGPCLPHGGGSPDRPRGSRYRSIRPEGQSTSTDSTPSLVPSPKWSRGSPADWKLPPPKRGATRARPPAVDRDHGPDPIPVRLRPLEPECDEVARGPSVRLVVEIDQGLVLATITASRRPSLSRSPMASPRPTRGCWNGGPARAVTSDSLPDESPR